MTADAEFINFGIIPLTFIDNKDYESIDQGDELEIPNIHTQIKEGGKIMVKNLTKGSEFEAQATLSDRQREIMLAGGTLAYMKSNQ